MIDNALRRWRLTGAKRVAETKTSTVYKALTSDRTPVAVKVLKPYGADEIRGASLMQWYAAEGAARIIDVADPMILMEWVDGETLGDIVRAGHDDDASEILCNLMARLHLPRGPYPEQLQSLESYLAVLFDIDPKCWPIAQRRFHHKALRLARFLLDSAPPAIPLHGDLHHDNVMRAKRGWVVIDPKGVLGDPAYEPSNIFRNPVGAADVVRRPERVATLARLISSRLGLEHSRILKWAAVHSVASVCWSLQAGEEVDWEGTLLPILFGFAQQD